MTAAIQFCFTGLCILIYVPVILRAYQYIQAGEVVARGVMARGRPPRRYTGASLWAYAIGEALGAFVMLSGTLTAFERDSLPFFLLTVVVSWLVGQSGRMLADYIGYEEVDEGAEMMNTIQQMVSRFGGSGIRIDFGSVMSGDVTQDDPDDETEDGDFEPVEPEDGPES